MSWFRRARKNVAKVLRRSPPKPKTSVSVKPTPTAVRRPTRPRPIPKKRIDVGRSSANISFKEEELYDEDELPKGYVHNINEAVYVRYNATDRDIEQAIERRFERIHGEYWANRTQIQATNITAKFSMGGKDYLLQEGKVKAYKSVTNPKPRGRKKARPQPKRK